MDYLTDIRDGEIVELRERVKQLKLDKYLISMKLGRVRSIVDQTVRFEFPITAIIGPNGGGKSTVLGAAALAYKSVPPRTFFSKSHIGDDSMQDWKIEYELLDRGPKTTAPFTRTSKFHNKKWARDNVSTRDVRYFGISRTVPATEKSVFQRMLNARFKPAGSLKGISADVAQKVASILGKPVDKYRRGSLTNKEDFYLGENDLGKYSELHFGAGEASVLRMVHQLESLPNSSLVLIEELENGLHPIAVAKMLEYLFDLSDRKKIQVIFSTHSDMAIQPLPGEAVWASVDGKLQQGKLSVEATRAISGRVDRKLSVFTEDSFAELWVQLILRRSLGDASREVGVYGLTGDSVALSTHKSHQANPSVTTHSICLLDGDSTIDENVEAGVIKLPGGQPENYIFSFAIERLEEDSAILCAYCQFDVTKQDDFVKAVKKVHLNTADPHLYYSKLGIELGFKSQEIIKQAFLTYWCDQNSDEIERIANVVKEELAKVPPH